MKSIRTEQDYRHALAEVERLMDVEEDTPEADLLDVLVTLVEAYEDEHWPIESPEDKIVSRAVFPRARK